MNENPNFRDVAYRRYSRNAVINYDRLAASYGRLISKHLRVLPEWRCLDLACGYGNFLAYLRAQGVSRYLGVDLTEATIDRAAREFGEERVACVDGIVFLESDKQKFDLISALDFVEHLRPDELYRLLAGVRAGLNINGLFLIRTPNAGAPFGMAARYNDITHETGFTVSAMDDVMQRAGFEVLMAWEDIGRPKSPLQFCHFGAWQCLRLGYRLMDAIETGVWGPGIMTRNFWMLLRKCRDVNKD